MGRPGDKYISAILIAEIECMFNGIRCSIGKWNKYISGIFIGKDFGGLKFVMESLLLSMYHPVAPWNKTTTTSAIA